MEERRVKSLLMICLVLGLLFGQSTASFKGCYEGCIILCVITPKKSVASCAFKCLKDCVLPTSIGNQTNTKDYCKLGCASSLCINISTKENPDAEKVEDCVDSCSRTCTKN